MVLGGCQQRGRLAGLVGAIVDTINTEGVAIAYLKDVGRCGGGGKWMAMGLAARAAFSGLLSGMVVARRVALARRLVMSVVAVDDVGRHELVENSRNGLNADEAPGEAGDYEQAGRLIGPSCVLEVMLGLGQHAIER
jgi:hypothetical protein